MKKSGINYIITTLGILFIGTGLFFIKSIIDPQGIMKALPYICVGLGCGAFGHGLGNIISQKSLKNSPIIQKQQEIDNKDERNVAIRNSAKAKAYDMMIFVLGALMLSYALMGIDMIVVLLLVFAYLLIISSSLFYHFKYNKEM